MSLYQEVSTNMNFVEREQETARFWEENRTFQKSVEELEGHPSYVFYDGPPHANGKPHIGHLQTRSFKDLFPRFHTMKGQMVPRKAGWDTHGLPGGAGSGKSCCTSMGRTRSKPTAIAPFIEKCKESVWKYKGMWEDFSKDVGFWADMDHPYVTYDNSFIESEWWALKQIWDKGLLYKGFKIVPYCPPLRHAPVLSRGGPGLQRRERALRHRQVPGQGRGRLHPGLDHHPLDPALQRGAVRQRQ